MHEGRRRVAVTGGRLALLVLATATGWGAITSAGGGHAVGAVLVGAPAFAAVNPRPTVSVAPASAARALLPPVRARSSARVLRVSRELIRRPVDRGRSRHLDQR
jgi:hypothetical protein